MLNVLTIAKCNIFKMGLQWQWTLSQGRFTKLFCKCDKKWTIIW